MQERSERERGTDRQREGQRERESEENTQLRINTTKPLTWNASEGTVSL